MQKLVYQNANGEELDLTDGVKFGVTTWEGFSNCNLTVQTQMVPFADGSVYLDGLLGERELAITVAVNDNGDLGLRYQLKRELISMLNPKLGEGYLIYTNDYLSRRIKVVPYLPTFGNKNIDTAGTLKASCTFKACDPYWEDIEESFVTFGIAEHPIINNDGDVVVSAKIEFFVNNSVVNPRITRETDNHYIEYNGELDDNLIVKTGIGEKSANIETKSLSLIGIGVNLTAIAYSQQLGVVVAVGTYGTVIVSEDYYTWKQTTKNLSEGYFFNDVMYSETHGFFIAVGNNGLILTSIDGYTWTQQTSGVTTKLNSITYSSALEMFIVVGGIENTSTDNILTSTDGITWSVYSTGVSGVLSDVACSDDIIVAVGGLSGSLLVLATSSDGVTWTTTTKSGQKCNAIVYNNGLFVGAGDRCSIITSPDGVTWTVGRVASSSSSLTNINYNPNTGYVIMNRFNSYTSIDGITWVAHENGLNIYPADSVYIDDISSYIYVCDKGIMCYTGDGITAYNNITESSTNLKDKRINDLIYISELGYFVGVGGGTTGNVICYSQDLENWEYIEVQQYELNSITFVNGKVYAVGEGAVWVSYNLTDWNKISISGTLNDIVYTGNKFIAVGNYGLNGIILESVDGTSWTTVSSDDFHILNSVCVGLGYHAVGNGGTILEYNMIYLEWRERTSGVTSALNCIAYSAERKMLIVVGDYGTILTSLDGVTWTQQTSGVTQDLRSVIYSEILNLFIAVGDNGTIITSPDGVTWTKKYENFTNKDLYTVIYSDKYNVLFVAGSNGIMGKEEYLIGDNEIANISKGSDMGLGLLIGRNVFRLNKTSGNFDCRITYRKKYVGV